MKRKYHWTPEQDQQLRRTYNHGRFNRGVLQVLAKQWGVPHWVPNYRAQQLGIARIRESEATTWSNDGKVILWRNGHMTAFAISRKLAKKGFRRSPNAVVIKRRKLRCQARRGYSAHELGELMGGRSGMICAWIERGLLKAVPRKDHGPTGKGEHPWLIRPADVRTFIVNHTSLVRLGLCDKHWFVDLLTNHYADKDGATV